MEQHSSDAPVAATESGVFTSGAPRKRRFSAHH
jgi:hypothetical protein